VTEKRSLAEALSFGRTLGALLQQGAREALVL
jgi:hypothetical protein